MKRYEGLTKAQHAERRAADKVMNAELSRPSNGLFWTRCQCCSQAFGHYTVAVPVLCAWCDERY